jgi:hypothetical protein
MPPLELFDILPTTLLDKPFLALEPDAVDEQASTRVVRGDRGESKSGAAYTEVQSAPPVSRRAYAYACSSRRAIGYLRSFWRARYACQESFWFIDWQSELSIDGSYWFHDPTYNQSAWVRPRWTPEGLVSFANYLPLGPQYTHFLMMRGSTWTIWRIGDVLANNPPGSGLEELGLWHAGTAVAWPAGPYTVAKGWRCAWVRVGRFDSDVYSFKYDGLDSGVVTLPILETPKENPGVWSV